MCDMRHVTLRRLENRPPDGGEEGRDCGSIDILPIVPCHLELVQRLPVPGNQTAARVRE